MMNPVFTLKVDQILVIVYTVIVQDVIFHVLNVDLVNVHMNAGNFFMFKNY